MSRAVKEAVARRAAVPIPPWVFADVLVAFAVLVAAKAALVANNVVGTEAYEAPGHLFAKSLLFLGNDALGALCAGLVATLLALPWLRAGRRRAAAATSATVQALHGVFVALSGLATVIVGAPIDKTALDLAFLQQPVMEGGTNALSSSIAAYLSVRTVGLLVAATLVPALGAAWAHGRDRLPGVRARRVVAGVLLATLLTTRGALPFLNLAPGVAQ